VTLAWQAELAVARGAVREGLAALEGFGDLLGSRRVGPKALERARADLGDACVALRAALLTLSAAIDDAFGEDFAATDTMDALCGYAVDRADALAAAVGTDGPLSDARRRLALESEVRRNAAELRDAVVLCDLLASAAANAETELDLLDVLELRFGDVSRGEASARLGVDAARPVPFTADRHVFGGLVALAVTLAAKKGMTAPRLGVVKLKDGGLIVRVAPTPRGSAAPRVTFEVPLRGDVPGALDVAHAVARRAGFTLEVEAATGVVSIAVKPAPARAKAGPDDEPR
jgi:hypothetical protein